ncbi:MAG TPA: glycosyltransferase family 2 protein [Thermoleophilaceae bacterium]
MTELRMDTPRWSARPAPGDRRRMRLMMSVALPLALFYFAWMLEPGRMGNPLLYGLLLVAELFNLVQALGFWWTSSVQRGRPPLRRRVGGEPAEVDVFIPTYDEPAEVVEPTVAAACLMHGADVNVHLLDDGDRPEMASLAARHGANYIRRDEHVGAKAGNINHALALTSAPYVAVLDCDHVPDERFLAATLGHLCDERVALVQTPQYYANARQSRIASAAWAQQALFFGPIACGKDGMGAMFCCGTNAVFRRSALEQVGGFPQESLTEDFELSVHLHERGWRTAYVPEVLARGLGPEDMASYVSQQQRWARGCLSGIRTAVRARLPLRIRVQYLLSSMFFLTGWTVLIYMAMPILRIATGAQPIAAVGGDAFLAHFAPYFGWALLTVARAGAGTYTFNAFALQTASFWIHIQATLLTLMGRRGSFVVTPKRGQRKRQLRPIWPALAMLGVLAGAAVYGLAESQTPATLNNVAFALLHITVLLAGVWGALVPNAPAPEHAAVGPGTRERAAAESLQGAPA